MGSPQNFRNAMNEEYIRLTIIRYLDETYDLGNGENIALSELKEALLKDKILLSENIEEMIKKSVQYYSDDKFKRRYRLITKKENGIEYLTIEADLNDEAVEERNKRITKKALEDKNKKISRIARRRLREFIHSCNILRLTDETILERIKPYTSEVEEIQAEIEIAISDEKEKLMIARIKDYIMMSKKENTKPSTQGAMDEFTKEEISASGNGLKELIQETFIENYINECKEQGIELTIEGAMALVSEEDIMETKCLLEAKVRDAIQEGKRQREQR